jgi:transposase
LITYARLVEVAEVYRRAHAVTNSPTQAVADHFERPRSTAAKWVQRAREEGLLGPTEERRSGEKQRRQRKAKK